MSKTGRKLNFSYFVPKSVLHADDLLLRVLESENGNTIMPKRSYVYYKIVTVKYSPKGGHLKKLKAKLIPGSLWIGNRDLLIVPGKLAGVFNCSDGSWIPTGITDDFTVFMHDEKRRKSACGSLQIV
ncbi:MAG: hypothetical protein KatS3mg087_0067 [Patescibacteria group bacterium]|nr:MAG: hypothetical protein KatS3mg087_0067 [Patescibacteria group bacterium]